MSGRRFHCSARLNKQSPLGVPVFAIGLSAGYWPCLMAPFICARMAFWTIELWHGLPSYRDAERQCQAAHNGVK